MVDNLPQRRHSNDILKQYCVGKNGMPEDLGHLVGCLFIHPLGKKEGFQ